MNKNKAQKDILFISISSFILVVLWIGFNLYHASATSTIEPYLKLQIQPIEPSFNLEIIQNLKSRTKTTPTFELDRTSSESAIVPTPTLQEPSIASDSATPTLSPQPEEVLNNEGL